MLHGKILISTRPLVENDRLKTLLESRGACVLDFPMIRTEQLALTEEFLQFLQTLDSYQYLVFTSQNGVFAFAAWMQQCQLSAKQLEHLKIAVVGKATAETVHKIWGLSSLMANGRTAEDLLAELQKQVNTSDKVLLVLGDLADNCLENGLQTLCELTRINVYRTCAIDYDSHPVMEQIVRGDYDLILFSSPSGYRNFHQLAKRYGVQTIKASCIGPTTEAEMRKWGVTPLVVSTQSDVESWMGEIEKYFNAIKPE